MTESCMHGISIESDCVKCEERIDHYKECKECRDLLDDDSKKQILREEKHD